MFGFHVKNPVFASSRCTHHPTKTVVKLNREKIIIFLTSSVNCFYWIQRPGLIEKPDFIFASRCTVILSSWALWADFPLRAISLVVCWNCKLSTRQWQNVPHSLCETAGNVNQIVVFLWILKPERIGGFCSVSSWYRANFLIPTYG